MKREFKTYKINPSLEAIGKTLYVGQRLVRTKNRKGVVQGKETTITAKEYIEGIDETSTFVKVYDDAYGTLSKLSKTARAVLDFIIHKKLEYNKDEFILYVKEYAVENNVSERTTYVGLNELLEKEIIYLSDYSNKYFINLKYICRGSMEDIYNRFKHSVL